MPKGCNLNRRVPCSAQCFVCVVLLVILRVGTHRPGSRFACVYWGFHSDPSLFFFGCVCAGSHATVLTNCVAQTDFKRDNKVLLVDFDEESERITGNAFQHSCGEIWHISASATHKDMFATSHRKAEGNTVLHGGTVWKLPEFDSNMEGQTPAPLEEMFSLTSDGEPIHK